MFISWDFLMVKQLFLSPQVKEAELLLINWYIQAYSRIAHQLKTLDLEGDRHMTPTLSGAGRIRQTWDIIGRVDVQSLFFLLRKIGFAPWPDIMLIQTLINYWQEIFFLTDVRQSSLNGLNWTTERVVNLNVTWLDFIFVLVSLFTSTVRLLFHSLFTFSSRANKAGSLQNEN